MTRMAGRPEEAVTAARHAKELYAHKGNLVFTRRVQDWLDATPTA